VPKRQPKPEPITPEEVMGSPALQGFDTFLRYRSAEGPGNASPVEPTGVTPIGITPTGVSHIGTTPIGDGRSGNAAPVIAEFKPAPKIRRALKAQDGHSIGEHAVYHALWNAASPETPDSRLIRIGYGGLESLCGLDKTNCKDNIQSLTRKLAIEVVSPFSVQRNQGNAYRIFSTNAIMKRRKAAGMEWVIRNKGVRFVNYSPMGE
jgi:hypothetical protein